MGDDVACVRRILHLVLETPYTCPPGGAKQATTPSHRRRSNNLSTHGYCKPLGTKSPMNIAVIVPWESTISIFLPPPIMKMSNIEVDMSCDPANPRRSQVPGLESVKLATEDCTGVGNQASMSPK
ncbi:unnamed protein product [Diatraea saccharalis]|uniref:Uncharacterized protein n=1 Tax=Diatraea saccharalis TaxID=40085 RepID=A0A9N9WH13_9NEOP|nr:unnamed protein product [Diatraea saccharalis]